MKTILQVIKVGHNLSLYLSYLLSVYDTYLIIQKVYVLSWHFYMFIPSKAEKYVTLTFFTMTFTGVKDVTKVRNLSEFIIFRIQNSSVFSTLKQSTTIIVLKVILTYSTVRSTFNYLFFTQNSSTALLRYQIHVKKHVFYINFSFS